MNGNTKRNSKGGEKVAVPKNKERITITIHKESKKLMEQLLALHDRSINSFSQLLEIALIYYGKACMSEIDKLEETNKGEN